jgi:hypothetical protein
MCKSRHTFFEIALKMLFLAEFGTFRAPKKTFTDPFGWPISGKTGFGTGK